MAPRNLSMGFTVRDKFPADRNLDGLIEFIAYPDTLRAIGHDPANASESLGDQGDTLHDFQNNGFVALEMTDGGDSLIGQRIFTG